MLLLMLVILWTVEYNIAHKISSDAPVDSDMVRCVTEVSIKLFEPDSPVVFHLPAIHEYDSFYSSWGTWWDVKRIVFDDSNNICTEGNKETQVMFPYKNTDPNLEPHNYKVKYNYIGIENKILENLHDNQIGPILLAPYPLLPGKLYDQREFYNFIFMVNYNESEKYQNIVEKIISDQFMHLERIIELVNRDGRFLIVVTGDPMSERKAFNILNKFNIPGQSAKDTTIVIKDKQPGLFKVYSWLPYDWPSGDCGALKKIILLDTWISDENGGHFIENNTLRINKFPLQIKNCHFRIEKRKKLFDAYYCDDILTDLAQRLTEAIWPYVSISNDDRYKRVKEKMAIIFDEDIRYRKHESLSEVFTFQYTFFVPLAEMQPKWSSMTRVFGWDTWLCGILGMILAAFFMHYISTFQLAQDSVMYRSFSYCIISLWSVLLGIGVDQPRTHLRLLFLPWIIFALCINTIFQTYVTSLLIDPGRQHQINSLEEIVEKSYQIGFDNDFTELTHSDQLFNISYMFPCALYSIKYFFQSPNTVIFTNPELFTYNSKILCGRREVPQIYKFKETYHHKFFNLGFESDSQLQKHFHVLMSRLIQSGIPHMIYKNITEPTGVNTWKVDRLKEIIGDFQQTSLSHLISPFAFMAFGCILSSFTFIIEVLYYSYTQRVQQPLQGRRNY